ncbi:MAG: apolipoprotein N-acyltransferase [Planctomycetia bacterium]|nr:apolipoprotein N-acyltransferase [Planctomycetia bacterium]
MLIQLADSLGAVGVGGVVMAVAAGLAELAAVAGTRGRWRAACIAAARPAAVSAAVLAVTLGYGLWRLRGAPLPEGRPLDVLLVQGSIDTELKHDPEAAGEVVRHYDDLTLGALAAADGAGTRPDLIAWPETMWRFGLLEIDPDETLPEHVVDQTLAGRPEAAGLPAADRQAACRRALEQERLTLLAAFARRYGTHWLVGLDRQVVTPRSPSGARHYNCGLFLDRDGVPLGCYSKRHPVLFGETVPLADRFPWIQRLTPLPANLTAGTEPVAVTIADRRVAVNICYETALPGAVRSLVLELSRRGERPDVIVNLTNDGWFWGSSELDMHLTAGIFRAVEVRTPLLIAANTGFSAAIDGSGRLLARGPRRATGTLRARVWPDGRASPWLRWGSLPLTGPVAVAAVALLSGWARRAGLQTR